MTDTTDHDAAEVCDRPPIPVAILRRERLQELVDAAFARASTYGVNGWTKLEYLRPGHVDGLAMEKHSDSIGLCLVRNWEGRAQLAVMMDAVLEDAATRLIVEQTVAMLPRWASEKVAAVLGNAPQSLKLERWQLKLLLRYGLISGLEYDPHRKCMMWVGTELLRLVVREMEKGLTTDGTEDTEGEKMV
jgi:hypothetical protein